MLIDRSCCDIIHLEGEPARTVAHLRLGRHLALQEVPVQSSVWRYENGFWL